jgi:hypothetical protein
VSFLDLYQGDIDQAAKQQPNEGSRLPSTFEENFHAAWSNGLMFSQSVARENARAGVLNDYLSEIRAKTGNDLSQEIMPEPMGPDMFEQANARVAKIKESYPDLDLAPLNDDEIDKRALQKAQAAHRTYETLEQGEKTWGGSFGNMLGGLAAGALDPINIAGMAVAPEAQGIGILATALRWGAMAGVSQAGIEFASDDFKEKVQPGYTESGAPLKEIAGAFVGGAVVGGGVKTLGNLWTKVKTGQWPTSVRDAGNVIESEANIADTNIFPGVQGEVAHREALVKTIDDILAGRPSDVEKQITPEMAAHIEAYHGSPHDFDTFSMHHVGEGEGAQTYGHGLYFAENEGVAKNYQSVLSRQIPTSNGRIQATGSGKFNIVDDFGIQAGPFDSKEQAELSLKGTSGSLYQVRINADRRKMLDWDKPIGEQPDIAAAFENITPKPGWLARQIEGLKVIRYEMATDPSSTGGKAYGALSRTLGGDDKASAALADAGVPGIKYFDQGSRDASEGTRNFVVFNDKDIQITHKNGKPVNAETRQGVVDQAMGLPPKQPELPLNVPEPEPPKVTAKEQGPLPPLQTSEQMNKTLTAPDHQEAIRADIDRALAMASGDLKPPSKYPDREYTVEAFHGTNDVITKFDPDKTRLDRGVFFSNDPELANRFAQGFATDSDAAHFPDEPGFLDWIKPLISKKEFGPIAEMHAEFEAAGERMAKSGFEGEAYLKAQHEYTELSNKLNNEAKKVSQYIDHETGEYTKAPNVSPVQLRLGKTHEVDMGGKFDWDIELDAINYARNNGFDSITFSNLGEGDAKVYSMLSADSIKPKFIARELMVPGIDENGNHVMVGVDKAVDQVDAYKLVAEQLQACANPVQEAAE